MEIKTFESFNYENHNSFKNKLKEFISDNDTINKILNLIPSEIILPNFYIGDSVLNIDDKIVKITDIGLKNGIYIYYYKDEDEDIVYDYEDTFKNI